jgi:hypothetical protein
MATYLTAPMLFAPFPSEMEATDEREENYTALVEAATKQANRNANNRSMFCCIGANEEQSGAGDVFLNLSMHSTSYNTGWES